MKYRVGYGVITLVVLIGLLTASFAFGQSDEDTNRFGFGGRWSATGGRNCSGYGQNGFQNNGSYGPGMKGGYRQSGRSGSGQQSYGPGSMPGGGMMGGWGSNSSLSGDRITLDGAADAVQEFLAEIGSGDLELAEVMEFEGNFYAIAAEKSTGIGALELLVDPFSGRVFYEPGPNMMWNTKYGHMGSGFRRFDPPMDISEEEAIRIADRAMKAEGLDMKADDHAREFYGYYTLHVLEDGEIAGMISVNGSDGSVWFHNWHGDFITMEGSH